MSLYTNQTNITKNSYFFQLANISSLVSNNISAITVRANTGVFNNLLANNISSLTLSTGSIVADTISTNTFRVNNIDGAGRIESYEFSSVFTYADEGTVSTLFTEHIILDQATLDVVGGNVLLLNGTPIATTNTSISSLTEWSAYPAICTLKMSGSNIENAGNIYCQNIYNALNVQSDTLSLLTSMTSPAATFTNARVTNGLSTLNFVGSNILGSNVSSINLQAQNGRFGYISTLGISTGLINGLPYTAGSNWSQYPATSDVAMAGYNIKSSSNLTITAARNITLSTVNGGLVNWNTNVVTGDFNVTADQGTDATNTANLNLTAQGGSRGYVNITANAGVGTSLFGQVDITANGGSVGGIGTGGLVNINANTPLGFSNLTSAIKLNAAGINSYAGLIPSVGSLAGYNFIYGSAGVNICSGIPSIFPNIPLTTYLYGSAGIVLNSDVYTSAIYPYWDGVSASNGDLNIQGRTLNLGNKVFVNLSNVKYLDMDFFAQIRGAKGMTFCNTNTSNFISNADTIQGSNSISGYNSISATNVGFTTATGTTVNSVNINGSNIVASNVLSTVQLNMSSVRGYSVNATLGNFSTLNTSSILSPIYGTELRIINTLPGSLSGGTGSNSVSRLIAEKPSGISTVAQIVAADTGMTVAAFKKDNTLTNMLLNASTISTSAATFDSLSFGCSTINGQKLPYPYGSFSANFSQLLGVANTSLSTILDTTEIANGIHLVGASTTKVAVSTSGVYRWLASPQFDTSSGGQNTVSFWFQQNGTPIPRTASRMTIQNNGELFSAVEILTRMNAQDYIETCFTSSDTNMNLAYYPASGVVPAVPSIILTGQKVAES